MAGGTVTVAVGTAVGLLTGETVMVTVGVGAVLVLTVGVGAVLVVAVGVTRTVVVGVGVDVLGANVAGGVTCPV